MCITVCFQLCSGSPQQNDIGIFNDSLFNNVFIHGSEEVVVRCMTGTTTSWSRMFS